MEWGNPFPSSATFKTAGECLASKSSRIFSNWMTHHGEIFRRSWSAAVSMRCFNCFEREIVREVFSGERTGCFSFMRLIYK